MSETCRVCGAAGEHDPACEYHVSNIISRRVVDRTNTHVGRIAMTEWESEVMEAQRRQGVVDRRTTAVQIALGTRASAAEPMAETLVRAKQLFDFIENGDVPTAEVTTLRSVN